jgi:hypothetical protein
MADEKVAPEFLCNALAPRGECENPDLAEHFCFVTA